MHTLLTPRRHGAQELWGRDWTNMTNPKLMKNTHALPVPVCLQTDSTPKRGGVSRLHDAVAKFRTGVMVLAPIQEGANGGTHFSVNYYFFRPNIN